MKNYFSSFIITSIFLISSAEAQIPKEVPHPDNNKPLNLLDPADIIIYIVIPAIFIILFFVWRSRQKKNK
tara:strand:+ start:264 stop:473 length:210 start_codon:yes stop_codon:yes gene_type:complete